MYASITRLCRTLAVIASLALPPSLVSCIDSHTVFHRYVPVADSGWDTCSYVRLAFVLDSAEHERDVDMAVEMRLQADYPYANLWLEVSDNACDSATFAVDTLQVRTVADDGSRCGTFAAGLYTLSLPGRRLTSLRNGEVEVRIRHLMGCSPLHGVRDVGIRVVRSGYDE